MNMFRITVPASSANIGPCFDSAGLALNRYLTLDVMEHDKWEFEHHSHLLPSSTNHEDHFIYQIAKQTANIYQKKLPACKVLVDSQIPLARGLGSSASAILAGIELANQLCDLRLSEQEKLDTGTIIEGHPDNIAAALFGGVVLSLKNDEEETTYFRLPSLNLDLIVYIPNFELKTKAARNALPKSYTRQEAAHASGISNLMIAALISGDYILAGKMMEQDIFHEPYRASLISNYQMIREHAKKFGAYGTVISGAGPTLISFVPKGKGRTIVEQVHALFLDYQVSALALDLNGVQVK
ncbi:homoserine kinase [Lentibacillus sp. N15]|uniref:homoserine kinase n=1 Tax=Lentibacillus songyuanensis TaxID=3136161 RepID=UPI0031BA9573